MIIKHIPNLSISVTLVTETGPPRDFGGPGHLQEMRPLTIHTGAIVYSTVSIHHAITKGISNAYILPQQNTIHYNL